MFDELRKIPVFLVRDFKIMFTYKLAFSMTFFSIIFTLFHLALFGSMFGLTDIPALENYGHNFISYILVGSIGWGFLWTIMAATSEGLTTEMMLGTLESILITPTKAYTLMISYALFGCFAGLITILILVIVGFFVFGISVLAGATIYTLIIFILSATMMMGFGLIFGGLTIWLKNIGDTVPFLQNLSMFFCGVYFPISVLPAFLQPISKFIPFYYSIEGMRASLNSSTPNSEILYYILTLLILSIIFILLGIFVIHRGLVKAKKDGSLAFY